MSVSALLKSIPNTLTILRIILVVPFSWALLTEQYPLALGLLFVAGLTDGLDGFLARQFGWYTWFGSVADPVADKILLVVTYLILGYLGHIPLWLVALVVGRDIVIFTGSIIYSKVVGHFEGKPTLLGKICTFLLIVYGLLVLVHLGLWQLSPQILIWGAWVIAFFAITSGLQYVYLGFAQAAEAKAASQDNSSR